MSGTSGREPSAGGGRAVAVAAALASSLTAMVASFADADWPEAETASVQAEFLGRRLRALGARDGEVFLLARRLLASAEGRREGPNPTEATEVDSQRRDYELASALNDAAQVPLEIAEAASDVAALGVWAAHTCPGRDRPDLVVAVTLAEAAAAGASQLVLANLAVAHQDGHAIRARNAMRMSALCRAEAESLLG